MTVPSQSIDIEGSVAAALRVRGLFVAQQSTIFTHGMQYPENLAMARDVEAIVRTHGATPATVAVIDGIIYVGLGGAALEALATRTDCAKISRRDLAALAGTSAAMVTATARVEAARMTPEVTALLETLQPRDGTISAERVRAVDLPLSVLMRRLIPWAKSFADAPISQFHVGALVEGASGALYAGMNLEFPGATLASSVHGEGAATTNAWLHGETGIVSLAVGGEPCGYCRQFLCEFVAPERLRIWMPDGGSVTLADALPRAFLPAVLGIHVDPFHARNTFALAEPNSDALVLAALSAANLSHAPYSHTYAGVALRLKDGTILTGRHAENVAYNPGMPPLQAALVALRLRGYGYADITAAALAQADGRASQRTATQAVLATITQAPLTYARLEAT